MLALPGLSPVATSKYNESFLVSSSLIAATSTVALPFISTSTLASQSGTASIPSTLTITAVPTHVMDSSEDSRPGAENGECQLLGPFALIIQAALGALALLSLVYKRWRERPQRPLKVWAFDASKQVVGSALLHVANLLMSIFSLGQSSVTAAAARNYQVNPCSLYLLNLAIDTTIGIPILVILLRLLTYAASLTPLGNPPESIHSGNYGQPPKATWWLKQSLIYFVGLSGMKICVLILFKLCPWIVQVGDWALKWTEGNENVQVFFVMLFFPVVMNAIQYYIIDGFIKNRDHPNHEPVSDRSEDDDDSDNEGIPTRGRARSHDNDLDSRAEAEHANLLDKSGKRAEHVEVKEKGQASRRQHSSGSRTRSNHFIDYDPAVDGESSETSNSKAHEDPPTNPQTKEKKTSSS